ncbi:hypothetical protein ACFPVY_14730 [Flavobacterium qiangtangense]|uniref:LTXXQ motif family protein n=1 Tax=Flavobacterium qiangtangense TaxID=1442595 RepID=A0ABW1PRN1_9FLAO
MTKLFYISVLFLMFGITDGYSQYGGAYNNGYNNGRRSNIDRSIGNDAPRTNKEKPQDYATVYTDYLTKELKLDGLQQAVVKSAVNDNKDALEEIYKMDIAYVEKRDKAQAINDKIASKIKKVLSKEQIEKFDKLKEDAEKKAMKN